MSRTDSVVDASVLSTELIDAIVGGLEEVSDGSDLLVDPEAERQEEQTPFILRDRPSEPNYPHVIVEIGDESGRPLDQTLDVFQYEVTIRLLVLAETADTMLELVDGVRAWIIQETDGELRDHGLAELTVTGRNETDEEYVLISDEVIVWSLEISGLVHTSFEQ